MKKIFTITLLALWLQACTGIPEKVEPVKHIDTERYVGQWYEIARLDHSFERGLDYVTAEYQVREDGGLQVINRGYDRNEQEWKQATGKAYFVNQEHDGHLKVSFFGPFYGSYIVFELDREDYQYAFVSGPNHDYLWLLSRTPTVPESLLERFRQQAEKLGFASEQLIYPKQSKERIQALIE
ncbi:MULTISPECIES: lipocalin family protein [unclassified Vibrio]|uniref:Outer membrane lipoprotein Blc n=1 Tax=Vibrio sp. HB236076 TaxID=3232307 RepID=A0AB39HB08_9VIBR|nr:lipocalin family protein [Vibrio sp. HB161653]MDP5253482.1 lipocalin family protein [Vibrio sp. HB161653]